MRLFKFAVCVFMFLSAQFTFAQTGKPIQVSGYVVTETNGQIVPVPYANVYLKDRSRGDVATGKGFFSMVLTHGDVIIVSALGFAKATIVIPDTILTDSYSIIQELGTDTIMLAEAVIFPWPDRDHFRTDFLAMDVHDELQERAEAHLAYERLIALMDVTASDGAANGAFVLRQTAQRYDYSGTMRTNPLLNIVAWNAFFKAWKEGKFKKK